MRRIRWTAVDRWNRMARSTEGDAMVEFAIVIGLISLATYLGLIAYLGSMQRFSNTQATALLQSTTVNQSSIAPISRYAVPPYQL